ncbi:MAG: hypothetical protein M3400_07640 [Actinomycetota bacterium]|nr:hypothetical protein [Actinomycetota bacterium]
MPSRKDDSTDVAGTKDAADEEAAEAAHKDSDAKDDAKDSAKDSDAKADAKDEADTAATKPARRRRSLPSLPSLPKLRISLTSLVGALLVILVGVGTWLFLTRPVAQSPIELTAFDEILSAARSGIVDVTSFDYLTLDQDIAEIDRVTTDELHDDTIAALEDRREQLVTDQQVSATEVIAASVTEATATHATAVIVLRARVKNLLTPQETVTRYRIQVDLRLVDGRWLLTGLTGA